MREVKFSGMYYSESYNRLNKRLSCLPSVSSERTRQGMRHTLSNKVVIDIEHDFVRVDVKSKGYLPPEIKSILQRYGMRETNGKR